MRKIGSVIALWSSQLRENPESSELQSLCLQCGTKDICETSQGWRFDLVWGGEGRNGKQWMFSKEAVNGLHLQRKD